ncbi:Chaperone_protein DnaJ [Hexamita inflata]|uniref:Chaperone protein DnaJ n=1 Tax=Hexamita inflata TaxID=28002 RepID=A0AA86P8R1_9EUKA|nr:Chaperone protein DnaJ [Hexamita inflata]
MISHVYLSFVDDSNFWFAAAASAPVGAAEPDANQEQKATCKLSSENSEEPAFGNLQKLAKQLLECLQQFEKLTPNSDKNALLPLLQLKPNIMKLHNVTDKIYTNVGKKIKSLLKQVFSLQDNQISDINLNELEQKTHVQVDNLLCTIDIATNQTTSCLDLQTNTPVGKYLKALIMSINLNDEAKQLSKKFQKGDDITEEVDLAEQKVSKIHTLLQEAYANKTEGQFENINKFIDEVNLIADRVFALYMKTLTQTSESYVTKQTPE